MVHPSKDKGNNFEREVVNAARERDLAAERAYASNGKALGEVEEVDLMIEKIRVQAKRRKALPQYLQIPEGCDAVVTRQDRRETLLIMRFDDFLTLLKELKDERCS